tara:strand:- start:165 stop:362 length:198 start_codon:yes stop_codon:yes gene_type:complete
MVELKEVSPIQALEVILVLMEQPLLEAQENHRLVVLRQVDQGTAGLMVVLMAPEFLDKDMMVVLA